MTLIAEQANVHETIYDSSQFARMFGGKNFETVLSTFKTLECNIAGNDDLVLDYKASRWAIPFHMDSHSKIKGIMAGVGTGKTSTICVELQRLMTLQPPDKNGVRWTKAIAVRNTHNELLTNTLETWREWVPEAVVKTTTRPHIVSKITFPLPDDTTVNFSMEFLALPDVAACKQLRGKEYTFAWINEWPEMKDPIGVLKEVISRLYRFPPKRVAPIRWSGVLIDFNPAAIGSEVYKFFNQVDPATGEKDPEVTLYEYPSALLRMPDHNDPDNYAKSTWIPNPQADFAQFNNVGYKYWMDMVKRFKHDEDYIRKNVEGTWTMGSGSKSCFPSFSRRDHIGPTPFDPSAPVLCGADGGLFPAITFAQVINGALFYQHELVVDDVLTVDLLDNHVIPMLQQYYPNMHKIVFHDPGNNNRSEGNNKSGDVRHTPLHEWRMRGFEVSPISYAMNRTRARHSAVNYFLRRRNTFLIDPRCEFLIQAMSGQYQWKQTKMGAQVSSAAMVPLKNRHADVADSAQMIAVGLYSRSAGPVQGTGATQSDDGWGKPLAPYAGAASGHVPTGFKYV